MAEMRNWVFCLPGIVAAAVYFVRSMMLWGTDRRCFLWPFLLPWRRPYLRDILVGAVFWTCAGMSLALLAGRALGITAEELLVSPGIGYALLAVFLASFTFLNTAALLVRTRDEFTRFDALLYAIQEQCGDVFTGDAHNCTLRIVDYTPGIGSISASREVYSMFRALLQEFCSRPDVEVEVVCFDEPRMQAFHASFGRPELEADIKRLCRAIDRTDAVWTTPMIGAAHLVLIESSKGECVVQYVVVPRENGQRNEILGYVTKDPASVAFARRVADDHIRDAITPLVQVAWQGIEMPSRFPRAIQFGDRDLWVNFPYPQENISGVRLYLVPEGETVSEKTACCIDNKDIDYTHEEHAVFVKDEAGRLTDIVVRSAACGYREGSPQGMPELQLRVQLTKPSDRSSLICNPVTLLNPSVFDDKLQLLLQGDVQSTVEYLLRAEGRDQARLFQGARDVRGEHCGGTVWYRGVIEFSNVCQCDCQYCGMRRSNERPTEAGVLPKETYRLQPEELVEAARAAYEGMGIRSIILQSGEDLVYAAERLPGVIAELRKRFADMKLISCIGWQPQATYRALKEAGLDMAILKYETMDEALYARLKGEPCMRPEHSRQELLKWLRTELGLQTSSGCIAGLPSEGLDYDVYADIAKGIAWLRERGTDAVSVSPFIPNDMSPLSLAPPCRAELALNTVAVMRLVFQHAPIPAVSAFGLLDLHKDAGVRVQGQARAIDAGANVLTVNCTPDEHRSKYLIYTTNRNVVLHDQLRKICDACEQATGIELKAEIRA